MTNQYPPELLERLRSLPTVLATEILGQDHALPRIVQALQIGELGLVRPKRPRSSLLLLGPTGVGKTETVIVATRHLFGDEKLFRFDMSEYQTQESIALLLGGRVGEKGRFSAIREAAEEGSLLFDEIEKAHPRVLDLLLQLLDAARVTVATGETLDFSGFHLWLTSNLGAAELLEIQHSSTATMERLVLSKVMRTLRPELFARIQETVVYRPLTFEVLRQIAEKTYRRTLESIAARSLTSSNQTEPPMPGAVANPRLGARSVQRAIERALLSKAVVQLLDPQRYPPFRPRQSGLLSPNVAIAPI